MCLGQALRSLFHFGDGVRVQQLTKIGLTEQLAQLLLVDGESLRTPLDAVAIAR